MPTRNVNLTERFDRFVRDQVRAGRFRNASEVMRAGLHLLEQQTREEREKLALLRKLAAEGIAQIDQGQGIKIKDDRELARYIHKIGKQAARRAKVRSNGR
ncbi:MAG: type II toxin-antitoxin system ParD family antitoxin [Planctomycetaceae bacterium]